MFEIMKFLVYVFSNVKLKYGIRFSREKSIL